MYHTPIANDKMGHCYHIQGEPKWQAWHNPITQLLPITCSIEGKTNNHHGWVCTARSDRSARAAILVSISRAQQAASHHRRAENRGEIISSSKGIPFSDWQKEKYYHNKWFWKWSWLNHEYLKTQDIPSSTSLASWEPDMAPSTTSGNRNKYSKSH